MRHITFADQLRYRFDNFMARGTVALVSGLALVSLAFIVLMGWSACWALPQQTAAT